MNALVLGETGRTRRIVISYLKDRPLQGIAESLECFNRKERNLLMRDALGHKASLPLLLDASYCRRVGDKVGFEFRPADAWWATDYHVS